MTYQENLPIATQQKELEYLHHLTAFDHNLFVAEMWKYQRPWEHISQQPL